MPIRPCGLPSASISPGRDQAEGTSCTINLRFSSLKIAPGEILSSADKWEVSTTRAIELFNLTVCTMVQTWPAIVAWANLEAPSNQAD